MKEQVDLNCDLGESFGAYTLGRDAEILPYMTSANIACGFHAGDPLVMERTVRLVREAGAAPGAHPGFPDLMGFGRRNMALSPAEAKACVQYQIGALQAFCAAQGVELAHVKPHGALYNMAGKNAALAKAVCEGIYEINPNLILLGLYGSRMIDAARETGLRHACEVFADRAYEPDGSLVARTKPGSMITDEAEAIRRVVRMVTEGKVICADGTDIPVQADSVCIHGDGEKALAFSRRIRASLEAEGISIRPLAEIAG